MAAPGEEIDAPPRLLGRFRLGQDAASERDDGVGGEDKSAGHRHRGGLGASHALGVGARLLGFGRGLVDIGHANAVGHDANLSQQRETARTGRCENQDAGAHPGRTGGIFGVQREGVRAAARADGPR